MNDHPGQLPYEARHRRPHATSPEGSYAYRGGSASQPAPEGGIEDKLEKLAEVGKQKFDFFLNRAKEKYNDMSEAAAQAQAERLRQQHDQGGPAIMHGAKGHGGNEPQGLGYELANTLGGLWTGATAAVRTAVPLPVAQGTSTSATTNTTRGEAPVWNEGAAKLTAGLGSAASGLKGWFDGARTAVAA